jgi:hypothetical protein
LVVQPVASCYTNCTIPALNDGNYASELPVISVKSKLISPYPRADAKLFFEVLTQSGSMHTVADSGDFETNLESSLKKLAQ